ncbi:MAG: transporter substrate-binding domain-containing protein [Leptolyngbya sp. SIOISBB]|nr:transporter substrate-binding domain-containing protein [Leptolyngbya sp. SIOISBB]
MRLPLSIFGILLGVQGLASPVVFSADLETIQERGYLIVAVKDNWRPLGFTDDAGELVGLEIDIATRLAVELFEDETAVQFVPVSNLDRLSAVLNEEVDLAIAGVAITPMRQRVVNFSSPYYLDGTAFLTRDTNIQDLQDLRQGTIALIEGSEAVTHVNYRLPSATLVGIDSYQEGYEVMEAGQVEAIAADLTVLTGWLQEYPSYRLLPSILTVEPLAIAFPKGTQYVELQRFLNEAIEQWHTDGWLEERATYWGLP